MLSAIPVWPQTKWRQGKEDSISVTSPSFLTSTLVLSLILCLCRSLSSPHSTETTRQMSGSMYLFVFCVFAWIMALANLWLPVYSYGCAEELPIQHKRKLQKHIPEKSTTVRVRCEEKLACCCCCCINILDFKGNTAGAQRGIVLIGHRLSFSLCIETCAGRYTYIDTIQAKHTPPYRLNVVTTMEMICSHVFWL